MSNDQFYGIDYDNEEIKLINEQDILGNRHSQNLSLGVLWYFRNTLAILRESDASALLAQINHIEPFEKVTSWWH